MLFGVLCITFEPEYSGLLANACVSAGASRGISTRHHMLLSILRWKPYMAVPCAFFTYASTAQQLLLPKCATLPYAELQPKQHTQMKKPLHPPPQSRVM